MAPDSGPRYTGRMNPGLEIAVGRIEILAVDAVVNAANRRLLPGSGVDGALRAAAGPELTRHTATLPPLGEGEAVLTPGFNLTARAIIHTAAPVWSAAGSDETKIATLARCYENAIALADAQAFASVGFPCLGTGAFGWPRDVACVVAMDASERALAKAVHVKRVVFCCFSEADAAPYRAALKQ